MVHSNMKIPCLPSKIPAKPQRSNQSPLEETQIRFQPTYPPRKITSVTTNDKPLGIAFLRILLYILLLNKFLLCLQGSICWSFKIPSGSSETPDKNSVKPWILKSEGKAFLIAFTLSWLVDPTTIQNGRDIRL